MIKSLLDKNINYSIEEISLDRTRKLLRMNRSRVVDLVKKGKLKARIYRDSKRKIHYKFRVADIRTFQEENKYDHLSLHADGVESAEDIAKRIFNKKAG